MVFVVLFLLDIAQLNCIRGFVCSKLGHLQCAEVCALKNRSRYRIVHQFHSDIFEWIVKEKPYVTI